MPQRSSPWLPVTLSLAWPGLGQLYQQQIFWGLGFAALFLGLMGRGTWAVLAAAGQTHWGLAYLATAAGVYGVSPWLAYRSSASSKHEVKPKNTQTAAPKDAPKDSWYGFFLAQLLPGLGHFYIGQSLLGGSLLLLGVGLAYVANNLSPSLLPLAYCIWAMSAYHAYRTGSPRAGQRLALLITTGIMGLRLTIGYTPTWINHTVLQTIVPSESMAPTLQVNDRMFVSRTPQYQPRQGDIVVFLPPVSAIQKLEINPETLFVKRIVGLPGDQVQVAKGQVWVNRQPLEAPYASSPTYTVDPITIPPETYFVLGDNRNESGDSHLWGMLPRANILGQAYKIYWPPSRVRSLL
ncbi:MAG: signal peptidase I [Cyanobacteria bacterium P01_A01_bin.105]